MSPAAEIHCGFPDILSPLFDPIPYKVVYGGRGGLKSYGFSDALLIMGTNGFERILCARETQDSIRESVHHLLVKRIYDLGLEGEYEIQERAIYGPKFPGGRTEFIFAGLRHNAHNLKSLEGVTKCWVEEAQNVSKHSWDILLPTVRRWEDKNTGKQSEVWISFNPALEKDDTYQRWVAHPPKTAWVRKTTWKDAEERGMFPRGLREEMELCRERSEDDYLHIWEGFPARSLVGAIYRKEYETAERDGRITAVPYNRSKPVHTYWDLGFNDRNCIWFAQQDGPWWNFIDYLEGSGEELSFYVAEMQKKGYVYGTDWLPHDGVDALLHGKLTGDRSKSPDLLLRGLGRNVRIAPKNLITTGINAVRIAFPQCRFDKERCYEGLNGLQHYQWGPDAKAPEGVMGGGQERTKPLHNWASHPADALRTFAMSVRPEPREEPKPNGGGQKYRRDGTGWMR